MQIHYKQDIVVKNCIIVEENVGNKTGKGIHIMLFWVDVKIFIDIAVDFFMSADLSVS